MNLGVFDIPSGSCDSKLSDDGLGKEGKARAGLVSAGAGRAALLGLVSAGAGREGLVLAWFQLGQAARFWLVGRAGRVACFGLVGVGAGRAAGFWLVLGWWGSFSSVSAGAGRAAWFGLVGTGVGRAAGFWLVGRAAWFQLGQVGQLGSARAGLAWLGQVGLGQVVGQACFLGFGLAGAGRAGLVSCFWLG
ncbi:hypothetical protein BY996DRAFT_6466940 [Phakopsora pachyrhizi]|nr:hypothetical protein BY996DRAFT_6466940 [Phakopsora pachyrhizi]